MLFDPKGRRIPPPNTGVVNPPSDRYVLARPTVDLVTVYGRYAAQARVLPSETEFIARAMGILKVLGQDPATAPVLRGVHVPFVLEPDATEDLGQALDDHLRALESVAHFKNELRGNLEGKIVIAPGSRYERLIDALKDGPVVGYYFPMALSGFSIDAARRQMANLPDLFMLSGGYEALAALVGVPDLFTQAGYPPQLDLSALDTTVTGYGYHLAPYGRTLTFNGRFHNGLASDYCTSGLTVIAPRHSLYAV